MKASIVGCGTAGLASAIFLRRLGYDVVVYDQTTGLAADLKPVGAGLLLQPTGLFVLEQLQCCEEMIKRGSVITALTGEDKQGRLIAQLNYKDYHPHYFGLGIHRGQLFNVLYQKACEVGVQIKSGITIDKLVLRDGRYALDFENQAPDLLLLANGANSHLADHTDITYKSRRYPWGALWHIISVPKKSQIQFNESSFADKLCQRYESTKIMVGMLPSGKDPLTHENCVSFFWSIKNSDYQSWRQSDFAKWKNHVLSYWPEIEWVFDSMRRHDDLIMATYQDNVMKRPFDKNLIVLGDAAHAMSPQLGQGANMALMDAWDLFNSLSHLSHDTILAFEHYRKKRKKHLAYYQWASRFLTPLYQSDYVFLAPFRNAAIKWSMKLPWVDKQILGTLSGVKNGLFSTMKGSEDFLKKNS